MTKECRLKMKKLNLLGFDFGASSGRAMLGILTVRRSRFKRYIAFPMIQ